MLYIGLVIGLLIVFFVYVILPLVYYLCPIVQKHLVFQFWVNVPSNIDYNYPDTVGIKGAKNIYLESEVGVTIGVWHILPKSALEELDYRHDRSSNVTDENLSLENCYWQDATKRKGKGIIIYLHGNTGTRALEHRVEMYKILQKEDFHIFTLDYRGYGDSTPFPPTETGVITDVHVVYKWILSFTKDSNLPIFMWGHSLGTGVLLSFFANKLSSSTPTKLSGIFLEAPFSSFSDAVQKHKFSLPYRFLPAFQSIFISPLIKNDIAFESHRHIAYTKNIPILVLHAIDDQVIPYTLGLKLYKIGKDFRDLDANTKPIYFKKFGHGYAHKHIHRSPELPSLINAFTTCCMFDDWSCHKFDEPSFQEKVPPY